MATTKRSTAKKSTPKKAAPAKKAAAKKAAPAKKTAAAKKAAPAKKTAAAKKVGVKGVPAGWHTLTPALVYTNATEAIAWYRKAFSAKVLRVMMAPDGKSVWHAAIRIGDSILHLNDEGPMGTSVAPHGPRTTTSNIQLYVTHADKWAKRAVEAGATLVMPVSDMFWGDRMGVITDPFGHSWTIATLTRVLTNAQMRKAGEAFAKSMAQHQPPQD